MLQTQRRARETLFRPFPGDDKLNVSFEIVEEKNEAATLDAGYAVYDNIETITIRAPANKDCTVVAPVHGMCNMDGEVVTYADRFPDDYERWKAGQGSAISGMPLKQAPFLDKGDVMTLSGFGVHSVEQLADMGGHPLKTLGMKGRKWQQQALAYLDSARGSKDSLKLAAENADLKARLEALELMMSGKSAAPVEEAPEADDGEADEKSQLRARYNAIPNVAPIRGNPSIETLRRMVAEAEQG